MSTTPQQIDWVTKQAQCNAQKVFRELCEGIESDVQRMNSIGQFPLRESFVVEVNPEGTTIGVGKPHLTPRRRVLLTLDGNAVKVHLDGVERDWQACVSLNDQWRCVLKLDDGTELEQWQFRKKALEQLFFDITPCPVPADSSKK
ncbi:hypothetical protein ACFPT7_08285 [Acidicapsa dinghuensis]|uniref:Uncharacterized protein n=1 Tax=Acidicapsa dinghuensis TaxID=2218256 RepID=A0ABW1EH19_9BACT|nr:hypothetical protein [Acidicapsa dinghuensis]